MFSELKQSVLEANRELPSKGLVVHTWGNVSAVDRKHGVVAIKPSGVPYTDLLADDIVVVDFDGNIVEGSFRPSSDTPTHLVLYRAFKSVQSIVHTHSPWATTWAQAGKGIPAFGTTHADYFYGSIPCTRALELEEVQNNYEEVTGNVIVEAFVDKDPIAIPCVLVKGHAPFCWGKTPRDAVHHAVVLEQVARMAYHTVLLNRSVPPLPNFVLDKHYHRKHGTTAYYGQVKADS